MTDSSNQQGCDSDSDQLVSNIKDMVQTAPFLPSCIDYCIYKVPANLRNINEAAYTPQIISIGPLHHGDQKFLRMEAYKKHFLKSLLRREPNVQLEDYVETLRGLEERVRNCYFDQDIICNVSSNDFVKMMLLDGCFIVELVNGLLNSFIREMVLPEPHLAMIRSDLLLFENQLPYFMLEHLFNFINVKSCTASTSFFKLAGYFFCDQCYVKLEQIDQLEKSGYEVKHFLDLVLYCASRSETDNLDKAKSRELMFLPSATELHELGVTFKKAESHCFLDITFEDGVLKIPTLVVVDSTEQMLRNMVAMEQCCVGSTTYTSNYIFLMDSLISTPNDVALLRNNGIIDHYLGHDKEVARVVNNLGNGVLLDTADSPYYENLVKLKAFYTTKWNQWKAKLKRDYFQNPWAIVSLNAAVVLLICTLVQTVCSVVSSEKGF